MADKNTDKPKEQPPEESQPKEDSKKGADKKDSQDTKDSKDSQKADSKKAADKKDSQDTKGSSKTEKADSKKDSQDTKTEKASEAKTSAKPASTILAFNKWDVSGIEVTDAGLKDYINLEPTIVPKSGARYAGNRFHKSKVFIVERLINKLMVSGHKGKKHVISSGHNTGRAQSAYKIVRRAFEIIEERTKKNPIAIFVQALENAAPREEIINIEYGGARYPKAVESAPQRRVDVALRQMSQAAYHRSFNQNKAAAEALADEILLASRSDPKSQAIQKKLDLERAADSSR